MVDLNTQSLQYVCEALIPQASETTYFTSQLLPSDPDPTVTLEGVLSLHSRPGASKVILLDFDGHVTTGRLQVCSCSSSGVGKGPADASRLAPHMELMVSCAVL